MLKDEFIIDNDSKYPIYYQLYQHLVTCITEKYFKEGQIIPSETEMINAYGVSRITVRRAINDLENDGYVKRIKGKGTVVLPHKTPHDLNSINSFSQSAKERGDKVNYVVLDACKESADAKLSKNLNISFGSDVFKLERLFLLNGRIAGYTNAYMPYKKQWTLVFDDLNEDTSLFDKLSQNDINIAYTDETIEVIKPSILVKNELHIKNSDPVVLSVHRAYGINEEVLVYTETYFIYSTFKYSTTTRRKK